MVMICLRSFLRHFLGNWDNDGIYIGSCFFLFKLSSCQVAIINWQLILKNKAKQNVICCRLDHSKSFWMARYKWVFFSCQLLHRFSSHIFQYILTMYKFGIPTALLVQLHLIYIMYMSPLLWENLFFNLYVSYYLCIDSKVTSLDDLGIQV